MAVTTVAVATVAVTAAIDVVRWEGCHGKTSWY